MEKYEAVKALVGEQNMQTAFWVMVGGLVLSNISHVINGIFSHYRWKIKVKNDLNEAFKRIRALETNKQESEK